MHESGGTGRGIRRLHELIMYYIHCHQETGEIQTVYSLESEEEINKVWEEECNTLDVYTEIDELLTLSRNDTVIDWYHLTAEQCVN